MEWIYTQAKVSGQCSLELAPENRENEKWQFFKHLVLTYTIVVMNDIGLDNTEFAGDSDFQLEIPQNYLF
jgi:hypothetical protein